MVGTDKQIIWAEDIRGRWLDGQHANLLKTPGATETYIQDVDVKNADGALVFLAGEKRKRLNAEGERAWTTLQRAAASIDQAKWWIDNRDNLRAAMAPIYEAEAKKMEEKKNEDKNG